MTFAAASPRTLAPAEPRPQDAAPVHALFRRAGLAAPPRELDSFRLDTDRAPDGGLKVLVRFATTREALARFVAGSASTSRPPPYPIAGPEGRGGPHWATAPPERDHPWWDPPSVGARRFAFGSGSFDFVELIVDDRRGTAWIRAIA